jgi:hypothetical protein
MLAQDRRITGYEGSGRICRMQGKPPHPQKISCVSCRSFAAILHILFLFLSACSPSSQNDFRLEGESLCREMIQELQRVETHQQLVAIEPRLREFYEKIAVLMIAAKEAETSPVVEGETIVSDLLQAELKRIYKIEAGRELVERCQKEALFKMSSSRH